MKEETHGLKGQFNKATQEMLILVVILLLLMIIIIIIMNMQNKPYTIQFFASPND